MKRILTALLLALFLTGCPLSKTPLEKTAYRTIVGAKGFLDIVKQKHPECPASFADDPCRYLQRAILAKDLLIDAAEIYCSSPDFDNNGANCIPPTDPTVKNQAVAKLSAAIQHYNQTESDLRGVLK